MDFESVARIAEALLYEGYLLYPYRSTSVKNQRRFTFGCLTPPEWPQLPGSAERSFLQTECLVRGNVRSRIDVQARFLHLMTQIEAGMPSWPDAVAREVEPPGAPLGKLLGDGQTHDFAFAASQQIDGVLARSLQAIAGIVDLSAQRCDDNVYRLRVRVENRTPISGVCRSREEALVWSLLSCHLLLGVSDGEFVSLLDPSEDLREAAASCRNVGVYPVLAGAEGGRDMMLASPIILYDYPRIAAQSPGDLFDATEMDEMLTLRIRTLTPVEKQAIARSDPRAEAMLRRCEALSDDQLGAMHGDWRRDDLAPGMRVRLRPSGRADAFDLALAGKTAVIVSIERDLEDQAYVSVAIDDDPGQDLGIAGRPGHRFYFRPDEVEPIRDDKTAGPRILIAGIGNIFFGDDGFGVEVVESLAQEKGREWFSSGKRLPTPFVKDFGIRGFDLACALQDGYDAAILVDAIQRGGEPGTLHMLELDAESDETASELEMHRLDPVQVIRLARQMGGPLPRLYLVGCEPATLEPSAEGAIGLSEPVRQAVPKAIEAIESLVAQWSSGHDKK